MTLTRYRTKERAQGQLLAGISSGAVSLVLKAGEGAEFPSSFPFVVTIEKVTTNAYGVKTVTAFEDVNVTNRSTDTLTITRGFNGTTAIAFDANDYVSLYCTALIIDDIQTAIQDLETNKLNRTAQLRLGNTARRLPYFGASGNEVELAFSTSGYVLQTNGATSAPTWVAPTVNITGLTEDTTPDGANDFTIVYDTSAGSNKKVKPDNLPVGINNRTEDTTPSALDFLLSRDVSASALKKVLFSNLVNVGLWFSIVEIDKSTADAGSTVNYAHGLWRTPRAIISLMIPNDYTSYDVGSWGFWISWTQRCIYKGYNSSAIKSGVSRNITECRLHASSSVVNYLWNVGTPDGTNIPITRTKSGTPITVTQKIILLCIG